MEELCHELQIIQASSLPESHCSAGPPGPQVSDTCVMKPHCSLTCSQVLTKLWNMWKHLLPLNQHTRLNFILIWLCLNHVGFLPYVLIPSLHTSFCFKFTFHFCGVLQWVAPIKNHRCVIPSFWGSLSVFFFALDSILPFCEDKSLWSGCTRDEMDWDVSGAHPWERQKSGRRRGLAGQWGGIQQV